MRADMLIPRLQVLAAAVLFSTGGTAVKSCGLGSWEVACLRSGVAALALLSLAPAARRGWTWRTPLVGAAFAITMVLYVLSNKETTAANAVFLQSTAPLYVLLLAPWVLAERSRRRDLVVGMAMAVGLAMFFVGQPAASASAPRPLLGSVLAAAAGLTWGMTLLGLRWLGRRGASGGEGLPAAAAGNLLAFLGCLPLALPLARIGLADGLWVAFLGLFQIALAYVLLTRGLARVPAFEAALLLLAEQVLNPVWAWISHGESLTGWGWAGAATLLLATTTKIWLDWQPSSAARPAA